MNAPPDWIITVTDQEMAESCIPYSRGNLICPPLEWEGRSGVLFGADVGCSLIGIMEPSDHRRVRRIEAEIRYRGVPLRLHMRWHTMRGPIHDLAQCRTSWHATDIELLVRPSNPDERPVHTGIITLEDFARTVARITAAIRDGYDYPTLLLAVDGETPPKETP